MTPRGLRPEPTRTIRPDDQATKMKHARTNRPGTSMLHAALRVSCALVAGLALAGCMLTTPKVEVREPTSVRPPLAGAPAYAAPPPAASDGSIFQVASFRGLFEDRRARLVGDIMTIQIQEKTSAKQSSNSSVDRAGASEAKVSALPFLKPATAAKVGERLGMGAETNNTFEGKGATGSDNEFTGTITVTVIEVLANGNLMVAGEKQIGINQNVETLRFSGVVNPANVLPGNVVNSTQVADARLEVRGQGDIGRAQTAGWLTRFFLSFLPI